MKFFFGMFSGVVAAFFAWMVFLTMIKGWDPEQPMVAWMLQPEWYWPVILISVFVLVLSFREFFKFIKIHMERR